MLDFLKHVTHDNTNMPWYKNFEHPQTQGYLDTQGYLNLTLSGLDPKLFDQRENPFLDFYYSSSISLKVALDYLEIELRFYTQLAPKVWESLSLGMPTPILSIEVIPCSQKILATPDTVFLLCQRKDSWEEFQRTVGASTLY